MSTNTKYTALQAISTCKFYTSQNQLYDAISWLNTHMVIWYETANGDGVTPRHARLHHRAAIMLHGYHGIANNYVWNSLDGEGIAITDRLAQRLINNNITNVLDYLGAMAMMDEFTPLEIYESIRSTVSNQS